MRFVVEFLVSNPYQVFKKSFQKSGERKAEGK